MPFLGSEEEADAALRALGSLRLGPADELIVADNSPGGGIVAAAARRVPADLLRIVPAPDERSAYYARNVAAEHATGEWLLFLDADTLPPPSLIDDYFAEPIGERIGAVAGLIEPAAGQDSVMARWAASREVLSQARSMELPGGPAAATANLLVRRRAFAELGGFLEGPSLGTEFEFCWRLADAGWELVYRPGAIVEHNHRETLRKVVRQFSMYAAGDAWLNRRRPGSVPRPRFVRPFARAIAGTAGFAVTGQFDRARMKAIDGIVVPAQAIGYRRGNAAPRMAAQPAADSGGVVVATDYFPVLTEQFVTRDVAALAAAGRRVRVEAVARPRARWRAAQGASRRTGSRTRARSTGSRRSPGSRPGTRSAPQPTCASAAASRPTSGCRCARSPLPPVASPAAGRPTSTFTSPRWPPPTRSASAPSSAYQSASPRTRTRSTPSHAASPRSSAAPAS